MKAEVRTALAEHLTALADDELLLGHRDSEWCGHAPIIEEDIAFANLALDEIGHAMIWYEVLSELLGEDPDIYPDQLAFRRQAAEYRNCLLVILPRGDWAHTILRQYLFDAAEAVRLARLVESRYARMAEAAAKIRKEEIYHLRHSEAWVRRLGLGTAESHDRMQAALESLWLPAQGIFEPLSEDGLLLEKDIIPDGSEILSEWRGRVQPFLEQVGLAVPDSQNLAAGVGRGETSQHLVTLLAEMQSVARLYPDARW